MRNNESTLPVLIYDLTASRVASPTKHSTSSNKNVQLWLSWIIELQQPCSRSHYQHTWHSSTLSIYQWEAWCMGIQYFPSIYWNIRYKSFRHERVSVIQILCRPNIVNVCNGHLHLCKLFQRCICVVAGRQITHSSFMHATLRSLTGGARIQQPLII